MALLVKERKALETLEKAFESYFSIVCGEQPDEIGIDANKSVEERLLYLAALLDGAY